MKKQLESKAINYVTKYINTVYLYQTEDFETGTLLEVADEFNLNPDDEITTTISTKPVSYLQATLQQFSDVANYYRFIRSSRDYVLEDFELSISDVITSITGDSAQVSLFALSTFRFSTLDDDSACGDHYTVYFSKLSGEWCIVDIYSEVIDKYQLNWEQFDCEDEIQNFIADMALTESERHELAMNGTKTIVAAPSVVDINAIAGNNRMMYDIENAIAYAYTYTTESHNQKYSGNNTDFVNTLFPYYSEGNCINFASQCVWAGLGGNNLDIAIDGYNYPMDNFGSTASNNIWRKGSSSWINTVSFLDYVDDHGGNTVETTLRASSYSIAPYAGFSALPFNISLLKGAVLLMSEYDNNSPYHAIFVNDVKGTTYDDVYFCGNSVMRKNVPISFEGTAFSSDYIYIVIPHYFQINKECVTHTYPTVATSPTGKGTRCSECGYIDLRVTGQMLRPIPVNSTHTITANTNYTCYKIYVTIQYGLNGTPTTTAFYSTDSVSKAFTFTQKGLYFIKIQAMDSPETEPTSALRQHIFSVRVY